MPKVESATTNTKPASSPPPRSPHRVTLPITPAAVPRSNPIDSRGSPKSTSSGNRDSKDAKVKDDPVPSSRRATSEAPVSKAAVTRTTSTSSASIAKPPAVKEPEPKVEPAKSPIDMETFSQILELDEDDEDHGFSKSIVQNYFEQVATTFEDMAGALAKTDLAKLSALGHFLKGSSAALGVWKVQATCETMQHAGHLREDDGVGRLTSDEAVKRIQGLYDRVQGEYEEAKKWFEEYFPGGVGEPEG